MSHSTKPHTGRPESMTPRSTHAASGPRVRGIDGRRHGHESFSDDFDRLYGLALRAARGRGLSADDASDVAQETMARCYASWAKIGHESYLDAWVIRVSSNVAIDHIRKHARLRVGNEFDPGSNGHDRTDSLVLEHALAGLPRRQREVVVLRYLNDLPEEEVAAALGCSIGTVRSASDRGRRKLAEALGDHDFAAFRAPAEAVAPTASALDEAIEHGGHLRTARRLVRTAGTLAVVVVLALGAWVLGRSGTADVRPADPTTTTATTTAPPTTAPTVTAVPSPATSAPAAPPASAAPSGAPATDDVRELRVAIDSAARITTPIPMVTYDLLVSGPATQAFELQPSAYCTVHAYFGDTRVDYQEKPCASVLPARIDAGQTVRVPGSAFLFAAPVGNQQFRVTIFVNRDGVQTPIETPAVPFSG